MYLKKLEALEEEISAISEANRPGFSIMSEFLGNQIYYRLWNENKKFKSLKELKEFYKCPSNARYVILNILKTVEEIELLKNMEVEK